MGFLVVQIGPSLDATILDVFAGGSDTGWLTHDQLFKSQKFLPFDLLEISTEKEVEKENKFCLRSFEPPIPTNNCSIEHRRQQTKEIKN